MGAETFYAAKILHARGYADQRIGEILRELPKAKGNQYQQSATVGTPTKADAEKQAGLSHAVAIDLQAMAANPDVVQAVLDKAEAEGRVASRAQEMTSLRWVHPPKLKPSAKLASATPCPSTCKRSPPNGARSCKG